MQCSPAAWLFSGINFSVKSYLLTRLEPLQNEEACCQKHFLHGDTYVSLMFPSFATLEGLFLAVKYVSASRQKHIPVWQDSETLRKHVSAANVSGNMFPRFVNACRCSER